MGAIGVHHTATDDAAFDGPGNKANLKLDQSATYYKRAYAWSDPEGDPKTKEAYRFIHHFVGSDGTIGAASTRGCSSGIGVLNGGRGGTTIPEGDREGVWRHLAAHLRDAGEEPPELKRAQTFDAPVDARGHEIRQFEARLSTEGEKLRGYAALFNQLSEDMGGWRERIAPGAFSQSLIDHPDVRALWQHDPAHVLGRAKAGTLTVSEDETGLATVIEPPNAQWARDAVETIRRGDVDQMSFAFSVALEGSKWEKQDGIWLRTILKARLYEVSPVTFPAYSGTSVTVRTVFTPPDTPAAEIASDGERTRRATMRRRLLQLAELESERRGR